MVNCLSHYITFSSFQSFARTLKNIADFEIWTDFSSISSQYVCLKNHLVRSTVHAFWQSKQVPQTTESDHGTPLLTPTTICVAGIGADPYLREAS
ncbi:hypothetical protein M413DRAFT_284552 [Hebeloma cylindrosporum]|uniref:Uncharacterized protein n=1 Tax=Hebeloma cylindrosporum TaxID=76867 RepID=A0A0C3BJ90_HEBCY|nr:hypothetical protein M413DRAFT_284552 [Hebeloma cylindrosporum h7]